MRGPASLSVADATANENTDDALEFPVTLDRASTLTVTVDYATSDGTATAGADYTATSGTLTFSPGETTKAVSVPVLDDAVDDPGETMTLTLSNAVNAQIADATATGTINNSDQLQKAWIARFGRTVAAQVIDGIGERLATPQNGSHVQIAGVRLERNGATWTETPADDDATVDNTLEREHTLSGRQLLLQSAFRLQGEADASGERAWTAWGRISRASFEGEDEDVKLSGDVTTGLLGADVGTDDWIAGLALSAAKGDGPFTLTSDRPSNRDKGTVESSLTSVHPYAQVNVTDRLALWAIGGYGTGDMTIAEDGGTPMTTDIDMTMAAIGARGQVLDTGTGDALDMAVRTDALWLRATSDATREMGSAKADVTRLRLMVDTSRGFSAGAGTLTPSIEAGVRHDGGDAEEGVGFELGAGLAYQAPGFTIEAKARTLVAHDDDAYREWGASFAVRVDPGSDGRGLSLSIAPTWGSAASEAEQLWSTRTAEEARERGRIRGRATHRRRAGLRVARPRRRRRADALHRPLAQRRRQPHPQSRGTLECRRRRHSGRRGSARRSRSTGEANQRRHAQGRDSVLTPWARRGARVPRRGTRESRTQRREQAAPGHLGRPRRTGTAHAEMHIRR